MASPAALRAAAAELDLLAAGLAPPLDALAGIAGRTAWRGPAATRVADGLRLQRTRVADAADELRHRASVLRARADAAERTPAPTVERPGVGSWIG